MLTSNLIWNHFFYYLFIYHYIWISVSALYDHRFLRLHNAKTEIRKQWSQKSENVVSNTNKSTFGTGEEHFTLLNWKFVKRLELKYKIYLHIYIVSVISKQSQMLKIPWWLNYMKYFFNSSLSNSMTKFSIFLLLIT